MIEASATIPTGHKVGLIGRNGAGKTTLFKLIRGELALDNGTITLPSRARIGGVAQEVPGNEVSLIDTVLAADTERAALLAEAETATDPAPHCRYPDPSDRYRRLVGRSACRVDPQGVWASTHDEQQNALFRLFGRLADACGTGRGAVFRSPIICCWTNRPTISIWKARCGLRPIWSNIRIR